MTRAAAIVLSNPERDRFDAGGGLLQASICKKKSAFQTVVDVIEKITGLDIDGDGTVGGDVNSQVSSL